MNTENYFAANNSGIQSNKNLRNNEILLKGAEGNIQKKRKILDIPISPDINKSNAFDQTRQQLLPKLTQGLEGAFYVEEYKFTNDSVYKG